MATFSLLTTCPPRAILLHLGILRPRAAVVRKGQALRQSSEPDHCKPEEEENPKEAFGDCVSHKLPFVLPSRLKCAAAIVMSD